MTKLILWFLGQTKAGKSVKAVQEFFDGKKQLLTGLMGALPASIAIILNFSHGGLDYLAKAGTTPEWASAVIGWGLVFNAIKGEKIRTEIAATSAQLAEVTGVTAPPPPNPTPGTVDPASSAH